MDGMDGWLVRSGPSGRVRAALVRRWLALRYRRLDRRYGRLVIEELLGLHLVVLPDVFNPVLLRSGRFLAESIEGVALGTGIQALDLGCGSGIAALVAARRGATVAAVDINPSAVRCTSINAMLNGLEDRIEVLQGDLFAPVTGRRFDLILFNPPYHRGRPRDPLDHAWRGETVFERFAAGVGAALAPYGRGLLVLSSDGDCDQMVASLRAEGHGVSVRARKDLGNELLTLVEICTQPQR
jgi:HemK-related putative methylase